MMADLDRVKRNISRMISMNAPETEIDSYIASEGATLDQVRAHKVSTPQPSWWQRNITGVRPKGEEDTPSIYDVEDMRSPSNFGSMLFGASDKQLADQVKTQLGDRFIRQETDENGYPITVFRDQSGQERRAYVNKPGLDMQDVLRGGLGALPYIAPSAGAAAVTATRGLAAQAAGQGAAALGTSVAGDLAQVPLGSEQGIEGEKAVAAGVFGAAGPFVARGVGNVYNYAKDSLGAMPSPLKEFKRGAINPVVKAMDADRLDSTKYVDKRNLMGQEGMLADMGPNIRAQTASIARTGGEGKTTVIDRMDRRTAGAPQRVRNDVDNALGPDTDPMVYMEQQAKLRNQQAKPFYDEFYASDIPPTENIQSILGAAKASGAYDRALKKMQIKRLDPNLPENNGQFLDLIKRELDGIAGQAKTQGNRTDFADFTALNNDLRTEVDTLLSPNDPAQSPWARGRKISGEGLEGREALEFGSTVFRDKRDPRTVRRELDGLSFFGRDMYQRGARDDIRRTMGRAGTAYGPKGDVDARKAFQNDFNRETLREIAGPQNADDLLRRIDAETEFALTNDMAQKNSVSETIVGASKDVPGANRALVDLPGELGKKGLGGITVEGAARVANWLSNNALDKRNANLRSQMAQIYTATGPERDRIARALMDMRQGRAITKEKAAVIDRIVRALGVGATQPVAAAWAD
jgi:hypothetical protein